VNLILVYYVPIMTQSSNQVLSVFLKVAEWLWVSQEGFQFVELHSCTVGHYW